MKQKYLVAFLLLLTLMFTAPAEAQEATRTPQRTEVSIDGLSIYPNPVTSGKVYITSTKNQEKEIKIFNVLGKLVQRTKIRGKELDVSGLTQGIYILKIQEGRARSTKKLVVR